MSNGEVSPLHLSFHVHISMFIPFSPSFLIQFGPFPSFIFIGSLIYWKEGKPFKLLIDSPLNDPSLQMDEELWPLQQQPLALWSSSAVDGNNSSIHPQYSNHQQQMAGCSTPLTSPIQKGPPLYPQPSSSHYSSPEQQYDDQQSAFCSPPSQMLPFNNSAHPSVGWPKTNYPNSYSQLYHPNAHLPYPSAPPPPSYFASHQQFAQSSEEMLPPASMMMPNGPSQQQQREQRRCMASQQKVQQWQQFGGNSQLLQDSGVHSMSQSTANSVMSSMSSIHPVSCISAVSSLPDEYPGLQEHPYFQNMPSSMRHEEPEKMRKVLPELIPLINDESEEIVLKALTILVSIAKKDKELAMGRAGGGVPLLDGPLISEKKVIEELLRTLKTHKKNKKVACYALRALHFISDNEPCGRELFVQTLNTHGTGSLEELVHCIGIHEYSCFKYAFIVLHNLMSDSRIGRKVIAYMCEMRVLTKVLGWLSDKNEKFLNIVTDFVHMLISRNSEQMEFFIGLNGHQRLIQILANSQQESLLYRAVKLLNRVVQMDPRKMISAGLLEAAQKHLGQVSQRLLRQILDCVRAASHVSSSGHNVHQLLQKLLQLLGTNDLRLKEACTDILANLCANNPQNKEFLVENGAIFGLFQLLHELEALKETLGNSQQRQGIQETALALLKTLCSGNKQDGMAKRQCLGTDGHKRLLLELLRQQRDLPILRRILMLLQQLAQSPSNHHQEGEEHNLVTSLRFALQFPPPPFPQLPDAPLMRHNERCSFASQTVLLLHQAMNLLPEMGDICQRCLDFLVAMAKDGPLLEEIFIELRARRFRIHESEGRMMAPQMLLCYYDQLAPNSVALLAELAQISEAAQLLERSKSTLDCLERWAASGTQFTAQLAMRAIQLISSTNLNKTQQYYGPIYPQQCNPTASSFDGEELTAVLNNSPAMMMEFSSATAAIGQSQLNTNGNGQMNKKNGTEQQHNGQHAPQQQMTLNGGEQLATFGGGGQFELPGDSADQFTANCSSIDEFTTDFGPFVSALCPLDSLNNQSNRME